MQTVKVVDIAPDRRVALVLIQSESHIAFVPCVPCEECHGMEVLCEQCGGIGWVPSDSTTRKG